MAWGTVGVAPIKSLASVPTNINSFYNKYGKKKFILLLLV